MAGLRCPGRAFRQFRYLTPPLAVYPAEAIGAHRAFIARRRATRPSEEYRTPTDEEWDAFLHRLKNAMFLAAFASLRDPASKAFYDRKRAEGKRHNAALICLARRRCDVILAMLRTSPPYQPARPAPGLAHAA